MNLLDLISGAGNLLDLPGSSVRDLLSGRNPFDQWTTPFSSDNRASGRDMLAPILGANKETGMSGWLSDPMEGLKDIAGFGAEVITDPMNLIPAGWFGKVLGSRKATQAANAATKAERAGKYSFVNPKMSARTADDAVNPVVQAVSDQNPMKLLEYTPPRDTVHHVGRDWSASATPEHPYGMFDMERVGSGQSGKAFGPAMYVSEDPRTSKYVRRLLDQAGVDDIRQYQLDMPEGNLADWTAKGSAERMIGADPLVSNLSDLQRTGYQGAVTPPSIKGFGDDRVLWEQDLINQMRVRMIDGQRVPINPTTLVQRIEQPFQRAAVADPQLLSNMNPMNLQRPQTAANPVALALLQNLLSRNNNWAGGYQ